MTSDGAIHMGTKCKKIYYLTILLIIQQSHSHIKLLYFEIIYDLRFIITRTFKYQKKKACVRTNFHTKHFTSNHFPEKKIVKRHDSTITNMFLFFFSLNEDFFHVWINFTCFRLYCGGIFMQKRKSPTFTEDLEGRRRRPSTRHTQTPILTLPYTIFGKLFKSVGNKFLVNERAN